MGLDESLGLSFVQLSASAAFLRITRFYNERRRGPSAPAKQRSFRIQWELRHSAEEMTMGTRVVSEDDLRGMFGLPLAPDAYSCDHPHIRWAHACVSATGDSFEQVIGHSGYFLRADDFLNVPGPGIGKDGDPNISIEITVAMRDAVQNFMESRP